MPLKKITYPFFLLSFLLLSLTAPLFNVQANFKKNLLKIGLGTDQKVYLSFGKQDQKVSQKISLAEKESYIIQSTLLYFSNAMHVLEPKKRKQLLKISKNWIDAVASDQGLLRISLKNILAKAQLGPVAVWATLKEASGKTHTSGVILSIDFLHANFKAHAQDTAIAVLAQASQKLSDSGLRLLILSLGAMHKWYESDGDASQKSSVVAAPSHGLKVATDFLNQVQGIK